MPLPSSVPKDTWFGGSIAAGEESLFTCAFRYGYKTFTPNSQFVGKCYEMKNGRFQDLISFAQGQFSVKGRGDTKQLMVEKDIFTTSLHYTH